MVQLHSWGPQVINPHLHLGTQAQEKNCSLISDYRAVLFLLLTNYTLTVNGEMLALVFVIPSINKSGYI